MKVTLFLCNGEEMCSEREAEYLCNNMFDAGRKTLQELFWQTDNFNTLVDVKYLEDTQYSHGSPVSGVVGVVFSAQLSTHLPKW